MIPFLLRRITIAIPMLLAVSFITFLFMHLTPGDILAKYRNDPRYPLELVYEIEQRYHFDKPFIIQYGHWLGRVLKGDLGYSFTFEEEVSTLIKSRLFNTLILALFSIFITWSIAIPGGIYAAVNQYRWPDKILSTLAYIGISCPNFFLALLLGYIVSIWDSIPILSTLFPIISSIPFGGMHSRNFEELSLIGKGLDVVSHMIIPGVVLATASMAGLQRVMRGSMLETLQQQYIVTARARGLSEKKVLYKHALRNSINPLITLFGYEFSSLLSGAALTEIITQWPGLGSLMLTAIRQQDTFLVMANVLMAGVMLIIGNLISDILLAVSDPRIRIS